MRIEYIKISNVLSFKHYANLDDAPKIPFDQGLNILIGQNGAGKSTALEVINFIFRKILFVPYNLNQDIYNRREEVSLDDKRSTLSKRDNEQHYRGFRLEPNWSTEDKEQSIEIKVCLDDIDKRNLDILEKHKQDLERVAGLYSNISSIDFTYPNEVFLINITLDKDNNKKFSYSSEQQGGGFSYLTEYNYYKELIDIYNREAEEKIEPLQESFTLIGGYRNYNAFTPSVSLKEDPFNQIQTLKHNEYSKSANASDQSEPPIFNLVRLKIAALQMEGVFTKLDEDEATEKANEEPFLKSINQKLSLINLKVQITLKNRHTWDYSFKFVDVNTGRVLTDINSLSAGQKSIIHLIFESYGRGALKGGVVIIDEPELHLHYQFQYEYLRIIEQLNLEQKSQYILVTHSEALISSNTIDKVKRFALDDTRSTVIKVPEISADQKTLIKILDNTRSTYAFFARKVVLVEGDTDRYFFKSVLQELKPELNQEIAVLDIGGKGNYTKWRDFFTEFGLEVFYVGDFDNVFSLEHAGSTLIEKTEKKTAEDQLKQDKFTNLAPEEKTRMQDHHNTLTADPNFLSDPQFATWQPLIDCVRGLVKVNRRDLFNSIRANHPDLEHRIESLYPNNIFILKNGMLEDYTGTQTKTLDATIGFCENIITWLTTENAYTNEIKDIVERISA